MKRVLCLILLLTSAEPPLAIAGITTHGNLRIEYAGTSIGPYSNLDSAVMSWMTANTIHDAPLAVRQNGKLIFSHAYTTGSTYPLVKTTNTFRLASISKMRVTAAFTRVESLTADIDFALLFNKQPCLDFSSDAINQIRSILSSM